MLRCAALPLQRQLSTWEGPCLLHPPAVAARRQPACRHKSPAAAGEISFPLQAVVYMLVKLVVVPTLMIGCAFALGLRGAYGRAAVLVAALPVSSAAFALCKVRLRQALVCVGVGVCPSWPLA